jgi:hypothetical protein
VINRLLTHLRHHCIAYVALVFAIGGGGAGAAIAATTISSNTIHACVSKTTGALYVAKRCTGSERALSFNRQGPTGAPGQNGVAAYGQVDSAGQVSFEKGMSITSTATGQYTVTITASACKKTNDQIPVITPTGGSEVDGVGQVTPTIVEQNDTARSFHVGAGYVSNGDFVGTNQSFNVYDECGDYRP